jgi:FkbM family methyltransferase
MKESVRPGRIRTTVAAVIGAWIRTGWRGSTGGPTTLAHWVPMLRSLPVAMRDQYVYVDLRDGLSHRLLEGAPWSDAPWEREEQQIMRCLVREGDIAFDIGAHMGLHTILLSRLTGSTGAVHAFELNPSKIAPLRNTLRPLPNVTLHPYGLADRVMTTTLFVPQDQTMASLANWTEGRVGEVEQHTANLSTLDTLVAEGRLQLPDFIKCDVEGAETMIFRGGRATLDRAEAPIILYEADSKSSAGFGFDIASATRVLAGFARATYSFFSVQKNGTLSALASPDDLAGYTNLLAVPALRQDRLHALNIEPRAQN